MSAAVQPPLSTREALLTAAAACFARTGYRAATVQAIAKEAGFTPPTVYAHFGSKQGLFEALVEEFMVDLHAMIERELPEGLSLAQRLEFRVRDMIELAARRRDLSALLILRPYDLPDLSEYNEDDLELERHWEQLFAHHREELGDRTPREAAIVLDGVLYSFAKAWVRSDAPSLAPQARRIVALVLDGVCGPSPE